MPKPSSSFSAHSKNQYSFHHTASSIINFSVPTVKYILSFPNPGLSTSLLSLETWGFSPPSKCVLLFFLPTQCFQPNSFLTYIPIASLVSLSPTSSISIHPEYRCQTNLPKMPFSSYWGKAGKMED